MPGSEKIKKYSNSAIKWGGKHMSLIKGFVALLFGIALLYRSHRVFINFIVFSCGLLLIYYGLVELKLKRITGFVDRMIDKFRK